MSTQTALLLAGIAKQTIFQLMNLITQVESETGITVLDADDLESLHARAMQKREFQKDE